MKDKIVFITKKPNQTKKLAEIFAKTLKETEVKKNSRALVIGLYGNLGSGKTIFVKGLLKGFNKKEKAQSPTFVIFRKYKLPKKITKKNYKKNKTKVISLKYLYHFDCYRIRKEKEISDLNFKEIVNNPENIVVVEWANKIRNILPKQIIKIKFKIIDEEKREILFEY